MSQEGKIVLSVSCSEAKLCISKGHLNHHKIRRKNIHEFKQKIENERVRSHCCNLLENLSP